MCVCVSSVSRAFEALEGGENAEPIYRREFINASSASPMALKSFVMG